MMLGLYQPGGSVMHRAPAGVKLVLLAIAAVLIVMAPPLGVIAALVAVAALWWFAGLSWGALFISLRPMVWIVAVVIVFHGLFATWLGGFMTAGKITALVAFASLISLTTKVSDMLDVLTAALRPLRPLGVNAEAVAFMAILAIRFVPALFRTASEVREAQAARGLERNYVALAVPLLMRALKDSDAVADALDARGWSPK